MCRPYAVPRRHQHRNFRVTFGEIRSSYPPQAAPCKSSSLSSIDSFAKAVRRCAIILLMTALMMSQCVSSKARGVLVRGAAASSGVCAMGAFAPFHLSSSSSSSSRQRISVNRWVHLTHSGAHNTRHNGPRHPPTRLLSSAPPSIHALPASPYSYTLPPASSCSIPSPRRHRRILAIGDIHGDLSALHAFLRAAQILHPSSTPDAPRWGAGDAIVVQTGDVLDRGEDELACLRVLTSLARQAVKVGGELIMLHGNHEAMNAVGVFRYVDGDEVERELGGVVEEGKERRHGREWRRLYGTNSPVRWATFEPGGFLADQLYTNKEVAVVIGRTLFVHAGLTAQHIHDYGTIRNMNDSAKAWFANAQYYSHDDDYDPVGDTDYVHQNASPARRRYDAAAQSIPHCLASSNASPVWMREFSSPPDKPPASLSARVAAQKSIDGALRALGGDVRRMVVGHTPQGKINASLEGKCWRIDVGASQGVRGGTPEVLEIIHDGGETEGEDLISVLTLDGVKIPAHLRMVDGLPKVMAEDKLLDEQGGNVEKILLDEDEEEEEEEDEVLDDNNDDASEDEEEICNDGLGCVVWKKVQE